VILRRKALSQLRRRGVAMMRCGEPSRCDRRSASNRPRARIVGAEMRARAKTRNGGHRDHGTNSWTMRHRGHDDVSVLDADARCEAAHGARVGSESNVEAQFERRGARRLDERNRRVYRRAIERQRAPSFPRRHRKRLTQSILSPARSDKASPPRPQDVDLGDEMAFIVSVCETSI
jgi:hypothetical protein